VRTTCCLRDIDRDYETFNSMDMWMWSERLPSGVQEGHEATLCIKVLRIGKDLEQRGGAGLKEQ
jgi:hypothetical protein